MLSRRTKPTSAMVAASVSLMGPAWRFAITALMQAVAGGIQHHFHHVFTQGKADFVQSTGFWQSGGFVAVLQPLNDCFLTMLWQAGTLESWLDRLEPLTGNWASTGISSSHGIE